MLKIVKSYLVVETYVGIGDMYMLCMFEQLLEVGLEMHQS
jgi:hypothetical protein